MLAASRRSSLPSGARLPESCPLVQGARSASLWISNPLGPNESCAGPSFSNCRSLFTSLSWVSVTVPALLRQASSDPSSSTSAAADPLWISAPGAKTSRTAFKSGKRSVSVEV